MALVRQGRWRRDGDTDDSPQGESQYLVEAKETVEECNGRRLARWLLESHARVTGDPVLVITFDWHLKIKAISEVEYIRHKNGQGQQMTYSSSWMAQGRPRAELINRSRQTKTLETIHKLWRL